MKPISIEEEYSITLLNVLIRNIIITLQYRQNIYNFNLYFKNYNTASFTSFYTFYCGLKDLRRFKDEEF